MKTDSRFCLWQLCLLVAGVIWGALSAPGCAPRAALPEVSQTMTLSSPAFPDGDRIPVRYTCDGQDISPPLAWTEPPPGTKSLLLIMDDPDAPGGVFTHWILFNLPAGAGELAEAVPRQGQLANQALQGTNDFGKIGYNGPCPPPDRLHHYRFVIYALDSPVELEAGALREQILNSIQGHILARGQLTATYQR